MSMQSVKLILGNDRASSYQGKAGFFSGPKYFVTHYISPECLGGFFFNEAGGEKFSYVLKNSVAGN